MHTEAKLSKRCFAFLLDLIFSLAFAVLLYFAIGRPLILPSTPYQDSLNRIYQYLDNSKLVTIATKEGTNIPDHADFYQYEPIEADGSYGYQKYEDLVVDFFTDFLPNQTKINPEYTVKEDTYTMKFLLENVYSLKESDNGNFNNDYYEPQLDEKGNYDFTKRPVLKRSIQSKVDEKDENTLKELRDYYASPNHRGVYYSAYSVLTNQDYFLKYNALINKSEYYSFLPSLIAPEIIFFLILPLCLPKGKTLGKLIFSLGVYDIHGYKASKLKIFLHYLLPTLALETLVYPRIFFSILFIFIFFFVDLCIVTFSKKRLSIEERVAQTKVIDTRIPLAEDREIFAQMKEKDDEDDEKETEKEE